ncbi:MAG: hypothetical protein RIS52_1453 [Pseudomonadota bacterium]|jgi:hypothetical protein
MQMRYGLLASVLLIGQPALADDTKDPAPIVVTAHTLDDTARALDACIQRKCPPDADVKATLAHAENQFVAGDYKGARGTLLKSIGRNHDEAKSYPVPVSDLYRANARIAANLGEGDDYRLSTLDSRNALRKGLPADDWRILVSSIEVGDMRARLGFSREAIKIYDDVGKQAKAKGYAKVAIVAALRSAVLLMSSDMPDEAAEGRRRLEALAASPGKEMASVRLAAKIILARKARTKEEADTATAALFAEQRESGALAKHPTIAFAPPIQMPDDARNGKESRTALTSLQTQDVNGNWVDIGFWVTPSGKTSDVEVLRHSKNKGDFAWSKPVVQSIEGRLYVPMEAEPGDPGFYMVERFTMTALFEDQLGSRMRRRSSDYRIERIDLTEIPPPEPSEPSSSK